MPPKRKASRPSAGVNKLSAAPGVTPRVSIPASSARQNDESDDETTQSPDDEPGEPISNGTRELDITNVASAYSQPAQERGFMHLALKPDHQNLPMWIDGPGNITLETSHRETSRVRGLLMAVAEPKSQPSFMYEYNLTMRSVQEALSTGLKTKDIATALERFSKNGLPPHVADFITRCGQVYDKPIAIEDANPEPNEPINDDDEERGSSAPEFPNKTVSSDTSRLGKAARATITGKAPGIRAPRRRVNSSTLLNERRRQRIPDPVLPKSPFQRLVKEIAQSYGSKVRFEDSALYALQDMAESYLISIFSGMNLACQDRRGVMVRLKDLDRVRNECRVVEPPTNDVEAVKEKKD